MRSWGKTALCLVTAATLFVALCEPAEARRRFRFGVFPGLGGGGGVSEKIDKVYDLPDRETYSHEGKYYDIGSFYQVRSGGEMHGPTPVLVLYSGDRYLRLDDDDLALIKADLGFDPTALFRAQYAAKYKAPAQGKNTIERREGESLDALRARARAAAASAGSAATADASAGSSGGMGGFLFLGLLVLAGLLFGALKLVRGAVRLSAAPDTGDSGLDSAKTQSFDERVAQRLREAREGGAMQPAMRPAPAGPRTFGRRTA